MEKLTEHFLLAQILNIHTGAVWRQLANFRNAAAATHTLTKNEYIFFGGGNKKKIGNYAKFLPVRCVMPIEILHQHFHDALGVGRIRAGVTH